MTILPPGDPSTWGTKEIEQLILNVTQLATALAGGIAVIMIIWGAFQYFTAYGNEEKAQSGKKIITWAIIGLVVIILANVIIFEIKSLVQ